MTFKDTEKWQRLDCHWQTLLFLNPVWKIEGKINITACKSIFLLSLHIGTENCSFCQSKLKLLPKLSSAPPHVLARFDTCSFLSVNSKHCRNACNKDAWHIKLNCINPALLLNCLPRKGGCGHWRLWPDDSSVIQQQNNKVDSWGAWCFVLQRLGGKKQLLCCFRATAPLLDRQYLDT